MHACMPAYLEWPQLMEAEPNEAQAQTRERTPHGVWVVLLPCVPCQEDGERPENKTNVLPAHRHGQIGCHSMEDCNQVGEGMLNSLTCRNIESEGWWLTHLKV